jgi:hypothetical protein
MRERKYQVRLQCGTVGQLKCYLYPHELVGRNAMILTEVDGVEYYVTGIVCHVYEQMELEL